MDASRLTVALITETFVGEGAGERLAARLRDARAAGAGLALLPELPLNAWCPASRVPREADAEPENGPRAALQAAAAREAGMGLLGGAIVRDGRTGRRHNTALLIDGEGRTVAAYRKLHLPQEAGFWEASHYAPGDRLPQVVDAFGWKLGLQICSDVNRPALSQVLAARGAAAVFAPRATPAESYERWRTVLRANAVTCATYVVSVNRPPETGVDIGGPSVAIAPDGRVLAESADPLAVVSLEGRAVRAARSAYPGYLDVRADLYARAWAETAADDRLVTDRSRDEPE